ncbi:MAG: acyl-CoA thioesterase [Oligoflexia bacterium]|nr:acyl-CoA thioesterase [Oligoflexia bacterium]
MLMSFVMSPDERSRKIYRCALEVRGYELDSYGHVNHAQYLSYLEHARWKMLAEEGITLKTLAEWKRWPVVAGLEVRYLRPTFCGDELRIETQVTEHRRVAFVVEQKIFRANEPVLTARVEAVIVNEHGKPAEVPPGMAGSLWSPP